MIRIDWRMSSSYAAVATRPVTRIERRPASPSRGRGNPCARRWRPWLIRSSPWARPTRSHSAARFDDHVALRAAGRPPIITVTLPTATTPPTCGFSPSTSGQSMRIRDRPPRRLPADQHGRAARPGPERRAVARDVADACGGLSHCASSVDVAPASRAWSSVALGLDVERAGRFDA